MNKPLLLLLPLFFLAGCNAYATNGEPHYIKLKDCQSRNVCVYSYDASLTHGVDDAAQNVTVSATFEVSCESTGEYAYKKATKYCLSVRESHLEHKGGTWSKTTELNQQLSGWFCFVQTEDGMISIVLHPQNETWEVVNFKKALVSGFQANFEGKERVVEIDSESEHVSHYRYIVKPNKHPPSGHMVRHFTQRDIAIYADRSTIPIMYSKEETVEYNEGRLTRTRGETHIKIPHYSEERAQVQETVQGKQESVLNHVRARRSRTKGHRRRRRNAFAAASQLYHPLLQSFSPSVTLNQLSIDSLYTLELVSCSASASRSRRDSQEDSSGETVSSLMSTGRHDGGGVHAHKLNVTSVLENIHHKPEDMEQVESLKEYLAMETDSTSAITVAVHYLNDICQSSRPDDIAMKSKMYQMIAPLTNSETQLALLSCLEKVADTTEWNTLLVNMALLLTPGSEFVARLESLLQTETVRDPHSLTLAYGALASRADPGLQNRMVAYLVSRLQSARSTDDAVVLIHALGNSGSSQTTDILLGLLHSDTADVQMAAINALRKHTIDVRVTNAFLEMLGSENQSVSVVSAIVDVLVKGMESSGATDVQASLAYARALASSARTLNNSHITELVTHYFRQLQQYDQNTHRRLRREVGNWDFAGREYDMIASYEARKEDRARYPRNSGYLWSQQLGVTGFNLQVAAGMFTGASESGKESKILGRVVAKVNAFGKTLTPVEVAVLRSTTSGGGVQKLVYVAVGGQVLLNSKAFNDNMLLPTLFGRGTKLPVMDCKMELFVGVATIYTHMVVYAHLDSSFRVNGVNASNKSSFNTRAFLSPSLTVRMQGSSKFNVMGTEGGTSLEGVVGYAFEAEGSVSGCVHGPPAFTVSTIVRDQCPGGYIRLSSWYKPWLTAPCGFEQCVWEGDEVQDSIPFVRWAIKSKNLEVVWDEREVVGTVSDWGQCPTAKAQGSEFQVWYDNWPVEANMGPRGHKT